MIVGGGLRLETSTGGESSYASARYSDCILFQRIRSIYSLLFCEIKKYIAYHRNAQFHLSGVGDCHQDEQRHFISSNVQRVFKRGGANFGSTQ